MREKVSELFFDIFPSPIGEVLIVYIESHGPVLVNVRIGDPIPPAQARKAPLPEWIKGAFLDYLEGRTRRVDVPYLLKGPSFYQKVWLKTMEIPYGETRTYRWVAEAVGSPYGFRAVGQALRKNPLPIIVPCHRVVGSGGTLVGFSAGLSVKKALLEIEAKGGGSFSQCTLPEGPTLLPQKVCDFWGTLWSGTRQGM